MPFDAVQSTREDRKHLLKRRGKKVRFPGQHPQEEVVLMLRRHLTAFLFEFFIVFGATILPIIIYFLIASLVPDLLDPPIINILILLLSLYALFVTLYFYVVWIDRYFDVWVLTNERLIDVEQKSFFNRVTSELELDKIQDVTVEVKGIMPTIFRYGNIHVQTAAANRNFEIQEIKNPYIVKDVIVEMERIYTEQHPPPALGQTQNQQPLNTAPQQPSQES